MYFPQLKKNGTEVDMVSSDDYVHSIRVRIAAVN